MRVCALVVTYRPQPELLAGVLAALAPQVAQVLVLDNASPGPADAIGDPPRLEGASPGAPNIRFHRCRHNRGLAWTQNLGARWAWRRGFDAVLTMDQDSVAEPGMVAALVAVATGPAANRLAAVAPRPVDARTGRPFPLIEADTAESGAGWVSCRFMIASGMLIRHSTWREVGPMRSALFIDHVDTEWCLRARAAGWLLGVVPVARLAHRLGDGGRRVWLGRWRWFPFHTPLRHYYMVRNSLWLGRQPFVSRTWWRRTLWRSAGVVILSLIFLPARRERAHRVWQAWVDARRGRMGPWTPR